ncbi:hypothetical protein CUJ83_08800 [Methanocella sp. CWC-04]|uniref:Uncharacterized protein n=2 Tax=Methanooceanicella nereidis TaxID=2052831 RepID=A0AAP2W543_9EURY|nr:hypothetical protein [Methanocella sp. CWC-04]
MNKGSINIMYIIAMVMLLLALAIIGNSVFDNDMGSDFKDSGSTMIASLIISEDSYDKGTIYERYCFETSQYFGLRG